MNEKQFRTSMQTIKNYIDSMSTGGGSSEVTITWDDILDKPIILNQGELPVVETSATTFINARTDILNALPALPALFYFKPSNDITYSADNTTIHVKGLGLVYQDADGFYNYIFLESNIAIKFESDDYSYVRTLYTPKANILSKYNTLEYTPTTDYHPATKKYVDDKVASVSGGGGGGTADFGDWSITPDENGNLNFTYNG